MVDELVVVARVAGRKTANELADLYITEGARLNNEHGQEAAIAFFETLRDNLIAIRPIQQPEAKPVERSGTTPERLVNRERKNWDERVSDRMCVVDFSDDVKSETDKAFLIGEHWVPKSQICDGLEVGDYVEEWCVTRWWADKAGVEYEDD